MRDLAILIPSRGRPGNIARLSQWMRDTQQGDTHLIVGVDADDPQLSAYLAIPDVEFVVNKRGLRYVTAITNMLADEAKDKFHALGHVGDDQGQPTPGWDLRVMEALERQPACFCNDLYPTREPGTLCCHVFFRSDVVKKLGYFGPPSISHMLVDAAWMAWGIACGIEFLADVYWEHLHYTIGKAPMDVVYLDSVEQTAVNHMQFNQYAHTDLNSDILKLGGTPYTQRSLAQFKRDLNIGCPQCLQT